MGFFKRRYLVVGPKRKKHHQHTTVSTTHVSKDTTVAVATTGQEDLHKELVSKENQVVQCQKGECEFVEDEKSLEATYVDGEVTKTMSVSGLRCKKCGTFKEKE